MLERGDDVGGTWHFNTYPGCACDVPSHLYSFSFAPNPEGTQTYSRQPEIRDYLHRVADDFGVRPHVRPPRGERRRRGTRSTQRLAVETSHGPLTRRGPRRRHGAAGSRRSRPRRARPSRASLSTPPAGTTTTTWRGKRVAIDRDRRLGHPVRPEIQRRSTELTSSSARRRGSCRTPNRPRSRARAPLYERFPALQRLVRGGRLRRARVLVLGFVKRPALMKHLEKLARRHMRSQVTDPELLERVTPGYTIGCKRILPSNRWYPALAKPNVELLTGGVAEVRAQSVVTGDGVSARSTRSSSGPASGSPRCPSAQQVRGRDGRTLGDVWQGSPRAHLGTHGPRLPQPLHAARPQHRARAQLDGLHDRVAGRPRRGRAAGAGSNGAETSSPRPRRGRRFNQDVDKRMKGTVWNSGCASWYVDAHRDETRPCGPTGRGVPPARRALRPRRVRAHLTHRRRRGACSRGGVATGLYAEHDRTFQVDLTQPNRAHDHACGAIVPVNSVATKGISGCSNSSSAVAAPSRHYA